VRKASILAQNAVSKLDTQLASSRFGDAGGSRTERARREIESFTLLIWLFGLRILKLRRRVSRVCQELATGLKTAGRPSDCEHIHPEGCRDPAFSDSGGVLVFIRDNRLLTFPATVEWVTRSPRRSCDNFSRPAGKIVILHRRPWRSAPVRRTLRRLPRWLPREVFSFFFIGHACRLGTLSSQRLIPHSRSEFCFAVT
jgi:hypothetical protein